MRPLINRRLIYLLAFSLSFSYLSAQSNKLSGDIARFITTPLKIPSTVLADSCYLSNTLLQLKINKKGMVSGIEISDNAEQWLKEEIKRIWSNRDLSQVNNSLREEKLKKCILIYPFTIKGSGSKCLVDLKTYIYSNETFNFNRTSPSGKIYWGNNILSTFRSPVY